MDEHRGRLKRRLGLAIPAVPAVFLAWFFAWPLVAILKRSLRASAFGDVLGSSRQLTIIRFTFEQSLLSTALVLALGLPLAWLLSRRRFPGAGFVRVAVAVPFVLPTIVVAGSLRALLGPGGPFAGLGWYRSLNAILVAHVLFNVSVVVRMVGAVWAGLDERPSEVARTLGASPARVAWNVILPQLASAIAGATVIVFLFCFTSFGTILVLGGLTRNTVETEIYRLTVEQLALDRAAVLVLLQLAVVVITLLAARRFERRIVNRPAARRVPRLRGWRERVLAALLLGVVALLEGAPLVALLQRSLRGGSAGYRHIADYSDVLGAKPLASITTSLLIALAATAIAVVVGMAAASALTRESRVRRRALLLDLAVLAPLGVSAVTVGYGFVVALDRPVDLRGSWWLIPIAHATVALPFIVRAVVPVLRSVDPLQREAARVLGADERRVWREIDLPIVRRALGVAAGFAAAVSLGEFGATAFLPRASSPTLPIAIYRLLGRPGELNQQQAYALAVVLVVLTGLALTVAERRRARDGAW